MSYRTRAMSYMPWDVWISMIRLSALFEGMFCRRIASEFTREMCPWLTIGHVDE